MTVFGRAVCLQWRQNYSTTALLCCLPSEIPCFVQGPKYCDSSSSNSCVTRDVGCVENSIKGCAQCKGINRAGSARIGSTIGGRVAHWSCRRVAGGSGSGVVDEPGPSSSSRVQRASGRPGRTRRGDPAPVRPAGLVGNHLHLIGVNSLIIPSSPKLGGRGLARSVTAYRGGFNGSSSLLQARHAARYRPQVDPKGSAWWRPGLSEPLRGPLPRLPRGAWSLTGFLLVASFCSGLPSYGLRPLAASPPAMTGLYIRLAITVGHLVAVLHLSRSSGASLLVIAGHLVCRLWAGPLPSCPAEQSCSSSRQACGCAAARSRLASPCVQFRRLGRSALSY